LVHVVAAQAARSRTPPAPEAVDVRSASRTAVGRNRPRVASPGRRPGSVPGLRGAPFRYPGGYRRFRRPSYGPEKKGPVPMPSASSWPSSDPPRRVAWHRPAPATRGQRTAGRSKRAPPQAGEVTTRAKPFLEQHAGTTDRTRNRAPAPARELVIPADSRVSAAAAAGGGCPPDDLLHDHLRYGSLSSRVSGRGPTAGLGT